MRFEHPAHPGLGVRLGYGLNLHPADDARSAVAGVLEGLQRIAVPLRGRFPARSDGFGIGLWCPARAAFELGSPQGERELASLLAFLAEKRLDPFTFNAFPFGGFHARGLKERVFLPTWKEPERLAFTLAVARIAARARRERGGSGPQEHLSLSTHAGMFAPALRPGDPEAIAAGYVAAAQALGRLELETGERIVLAIEPEPRSSANDTGELLRLHERVRESASRSDARAEELVRRHVGTCLDACHAAVEFEDPREAFSRATSGETTLGKLQFSSALALRNPDADEGGRARLFGLDEPVYLHQTTGLRAGTHVRALDLAELARRWKRGEPAWRGCEEWRCHFHVPVDRATLGAEGEGLATTRVQADAILDAALAQPERWGTGELHVEVETYTWRLFSPVQIGAEDLVTGLERELRHVLARLEAAGWRPAAPGPSEARAPR